jgi:hypothetical protein
MNNPTVQQAITYYRKVADEANKAADSLEGLLKILGEEGEIYFPAKRKSSKRKKGDDFIMTVAHSDAPLNQSEYFHSNIEEIRNFIGSKSMRVKPIADYFNVDQKFIRDLVRQPDSGLEMLTRGWIRVV